MNRLSLAKISGRSLQEKGTMFTKITDMEKYSFVQGIVKSELPEE